MTTQNKHTQPVPPEPASPPASSQPPQPHPAPPAAEDQLAAAKAEAAANWDKFLRAAADLDNYRKRVAREREELIRSTRESVILALLPALDNLERALDHSEAGTPLHDGLLQVQKQFQRALADFGVTEIVAKPGDPFDPTVHEAVSRIASPDHPEGTIVEQLHSAYRIGERLLRPARVVVSQGPPPSNLSNPQSPIAE
jgi:molecular chaperone GrpE